MGLWAALLLWSWSCAPDAGALADELGRIAAQRVVRAGLCYAIADAGGEGTARIGAIERRGRELFLIAGAREWRMRGPLAVPRVAGPGYKVWVIGDESGGGTDLFVRRIGVLARPPR